MSEPAVIQRRARKERSNGFEQLRAQGIALLQSTSGQRWTDHNLHDPGITMLESLCFALTELVFQATQPVADQLAGPDGHLDWPALSLHAPQHAFTSRATTAEDHRRVLLDRVSGLDEATLEPLGAAQPGVWRLLLKLAARAPESEAERVAQALAVLRSQRSLGEDVDATPALVHDRLCQLQADIELTGPRDAAEVLAEVFDLAARHVDRSAPLRMRSELRAQGWTLEQIYDGPRVEHGHAPPRRQGEGEPASGADDLLYVADLARLVAQVEGVKEVRELWLRTDDHTRPVGALHWLKDGRALRLHVPGAVGDKTPVQVHLHRRGHTVRVAPAELWQRVHDLQEAARSHRFRQSTMTRHDEESELPRGRARQPSQAEAPAYHSVQYHLPAAYGLGRHGVPAGAPAIARARVRQLRAYLALMEQHIANGQAQLQHLRELFTAHAAMHHTYWWQPLDQADAPGLSELWLTRSPARLRQEVFAPFDRSAPRRHRLLDHLLALHGETVTQNAMRQFCGHLRSDELDHRLLHNKAAWLHDVVSLSRDRASGFDYGRRLMGHAANTPGLARRAALLLGFAQVQARPLTRGLRASGHSLVAGPGTWPVATALPGRAEGVGPRAPQAGPAARRALVQQLLPVSAGPLPAALLRAGCNAARYRVLRQGNVAQLWVGPGEDGQWWLLGTPDDPAGAAHTLRAWMLRQNDLAEGLHLVEHVLLRPLTPGVERHEGIQLPPDFFNLTITALLPNWTVRTAQASFKALAEDTLRINCPVHLALQVRWLGFDKLEAFEADWRRWLQLRRGHARRPAAVPTQAVDEAARAVLLHISPPPPPPVQLEEEDG